MKTFKETYSIHADIEDVFAALTNPVTIELWSGHPAIMVAEKGKEFSLWDGDIQGMIIEIEKNKRIVQEWYFGEQEDKSLATVAMVRDYGRTQITVEHVNIPEDVYENIAEGWSEYIMGAIEKFFNPNF